MRPLLPRRDFLRSAATAALGAPLLSAVGCVPDRPPTRQPRGQAEPAVSATLTRPILLPWGQDAVYVVAPSTERPVAYMSMRRMQIWIDREHRDRLQYALNAHISVSTGVWRVPLPGDPPNIPITPGDEEREFEEIDMRRWDATIEPGEGDLRVMRGSPVPARIEVACQPLSGGGVWVDAEPLELLQCGTPDQRLCREDLMEVGTATRFSDRDCTRPTGQVRLLTWACREPAILEGA